MAKKSPDEIAKALAEPFAPHELHWEVDPRELANPTNPPATRVAMIPAPTFQAVVDRLNAVLGPWGWRDGYQTLPTGEQLCTLSILFDREWIDRADVGTPPEKTPQGTTFRPAVSTALITTAVKFGVGAYLLRLPRLFGDRRANDPRTIESVPQLPAWAIPDDWQPCGEGMARQMMQLLSTAAQNSNYQVEQVRAKIFKAHGYAPGHNPEALARFHCRKMMADLQNWIAELATKPRPTPPAERPENGAVAPARAQVS